MTIPATAIKFSDDHTEAWWVVPESALATNTDLAFSGPCDTCNGEKATWHGAPKPFGLAFWCKACSGTGRHCFEIEVEYAHNEGAFSEHRVYVLDIIGPLESGQFAGQSDYWYEEPNVLRHFDDKDKDITLPDDAKPGDTAVHLKVVTP